MLTEAVFAAKGIDGFSKHFRFFRGGNRVYWCFIYFLCNTLGAGAGVKAWVQSQARRCAFICVVVDPDLHVPVQNNSCCWEGELGRTFWLERKRDISAGGEFSEIEAILMWPCGFWGSTGDLWDVPQPSPLHHPVRALALLWLLPGGQRNKDKPRH